MSDTNFINLDEEVCRFFDESSVTDTERPPFVILMGGVAVGKTTFRKQNFANGYVVVDSVEIFLNLSKGRYYDFPGPFEDVMNTIGRLVASRAVTERRAVVTEVLGADINSTTELIDAMKLAGYSVQIQALTCDVEEALRRNAERGEDCVSAYYSEVYQRQWLVDAAQEYCIKRSGQA